jgi:glycerol kinase
MNVRAAGTAPLRQAMRPDDAVVVAIDQGSHATRAVAYDLRGRLLGSAFANVDTGRDAPGHVEHDGESLVEGVKDALRELAALVPAPRWRASGLAVQRSTVACWDRDTGALLAPVISWQDRRQAAWLGRLEALARHIHEVTGLPLSPHYGASKLRWCIDHVEEVARAHATGRLCAGPLASLLLARLVEGQPFVADEANASRTQLWLPLERRWSPELLDLFGVPEAILPRLVPTEGAFGRLAGDGLPGVPLRVCTGDQSAVPYAAGTLDAGAAYVNLGSGAFALRPLAQPRLAPPLLTSVLRSDAGQIDFALEGTVNGAGNALDWFQHEEGLPTERLLAGLEQAAPTTIDAPFFLNGVAGLGSPFWVPEFESRYVGQAEPAERFRAVVESIVFLLRSNLDELALHAGSPQRIVAGGGLARSGFVVRGLAAVTGLPVDRLEDAEATSRGLAFLAAGQPASWEPAALTRFAPDAGYGELLQARYRRWRTLLDEALDH